MKILYAILGWVFSLLSLIAALGLGMACGASPLFIIPALSCLVFFAVTCPPISGRIGFSKPPLKLAGAIIGSIAIGAAGFFYANQDLVRKQVEEEKEKYVLEFTKEQIKSFKSDYGIQLDNKSDDFYLNAIKTAAKYKANYRQCSSLMKEIVELQVKSNSEALDLNYDSVDRRKKYASIKTSDAAQASIIWSGVDFSEYVSDATTIEEIDKGVQSFNEKHGGFSAILADPVVSKKIGLDSIARKSAENLSKGSVIAFVEGDEDCFAGVGINLQEKK